MARTNEIVAKNQDGVEDTTPKSFVSPFPSTENPNQLIESDKKVAPLFSLVKEFCGTIRTILSQKQVSAKKTWKACVRKPHPLLLFRDI